MTGPIRAYDLHPIVRYVRSLDGEFYLRQEVAQQLGVSRSTLRHLAEARSELDLGPTHTVRYGAMVLELYTPERIEQLRQYFTRAPRPRKRDGLPSRPGGRPRIWTVTEALERARAQDRARKRIALGRRQERAGMTELAADSYARAEQIMAELAEQHDARIAALGNVPLSVFPIIPD